MTEELAEIINRKRQEYQDYKDDLKMNSDKDELAIRIRMKEVVRLFRELHRQVILIPQNTPDGSVSLLPIPELKPDAVAAVISYRPRGTIKIYPEWEETVNQLFEYSGASRDYILDDRFPFLVIEVNFGFLKDEMILDGVYLFSESAMGTALNFIIDLMVMLEAVGKEIGSGNRIITLESL